jgi:NAD(P)H dehydrogenase (quinone)
MEHAITGITGQVGGQVARNLLASGQSLRAVLRDESKAAGWTDQGCSVAIADLADAAALTAAFTGAHSVFVLLPANFDPSPGFPEVRAILAALRTALLAALPSRVVCLSTIGAQATIENLLSTLGIMEQELGKLPMPVSFLRPAWFMENCSWDLAPARQSGIIRSFLQPLDQPFPMVATADIARVAAQLLQETWSGPRALAPTRSPPCSPSCSKSPCACRRCRARPGESCSSRRACRIPRPASGCWMASTKAGSTSKGAWPVRSKGQRR